MKIVFIMGTTASGKSSLALQLADKWGGRIVNCDSIQCYEALNIGSAKPTTEDLKKTPHDLYSWVKVGEQVTVGEYFRKFEQLKARQKNDILWVVGGTGFYFQALEFGLYQAAAVDQVLVEQLESLVKSKAGNEELYRELVDKDPETAARISVNDHYRLVRAVEMMRTSGQRVSEIRAKQTQKPIVDVLKFCIVPTKENLQHLIANRINQMLERGLIAETQSILQQTSVHWRPLQSVGYFEVIKCLAGECKESELPSLIATSTLQLAKKQRTWFKRDSSAKFLESSHFQNFETQCGQSLERFLHTD